MKNLLGFLFSVGIILTIPTFADWGSNVDSIDAIKHWRMDDRIAHVRGTIAEVLGSDGFRLTDDTGEIRIRFSNKELREFHFHSGMRVEVRGRVEREHHHWDLEATAVKLHDHFVVGEY